MTPFIPLQPDSLGDAVRLMAEHGPQAKVLAGGQSLLLALKDRAVRPSYVLSLGKLPGLDTIKINPDGTLVLGAACTYAQLARAAFDGWHVEIGKVAGNLADRSTRNLATIGGAACEANPRYDVPTLLVATGAVLALTSAAGTRHVGAGEFFSAQGGTNLAPDEIVVDITFPARDAFGFVGFDKFRTRVFDAALVNVTLCLSQLADGRVSAARLAVGGIAPAPRVAAAAERLVGAWPGRWASEEIAGAISKELMPPGTLLTRRSQFQAELITSLVLALLERASSANGAVL